MNRPGINVIGHVRANLGVGVVTRQIIDLLVRCGHDVAAFDVDGGERGDCIEPRYERLVRQDIDQLPHRINVFVLGLGAVDWALSKTPERFFAGDHLNAVVCFWELPVMPAARLAQLDGFDVVIAASDFMRHVFEQSLRHAKVVPMRLPVVTPEPIVFDRASLGIPSSGTAFVFSFDPASDSERKNPRGVIAAFVDGVGANDDAWLVVRINNARSRDGTPHPVVEALRSATAGHPRIVMVTEPLSYAQVLGLYRACDVYVSLHRAEGLGLGMAEAMSLGMAVVATGWSGNTTFMQHANSCLVDYRMVSVQAELTAYREGNLVGDACWAEPDTTHAAALMRYLAERVHEREALGRRAADAMKAFNDEARDARFVDELLAIAERDAALRMFGYRRPKAGAGRPTLHRTPMPQRRSRYERATALVAHLFRRLLKILQVSASSLPRIHPPSR